MRKGWRTTTLGAILSPTGTVDPRRSPNTTFDYIDVSSVSNETLTIQQTQRLMGKDAPSRARKLVKANDVLFATIRPTLRRIAIVPQRLDQQVCSTGYFVLRAKPDVDARFVFYFLQTDGFMKAMEGLQKGASYPAVTDSDIRSQAISVPPLAEQQRIVRLLDEAISSIAKAKANAEKNAQNARTLFEDYLHSLFAKPGKGWDHKELSEVCSITSTLVDPRKKEFLNLTHVGAGNIEPKTGTLIDLRTAREEGLISGKFVFDESMVLYSKIRPYLMKVARPTFAGLCSADIYPLAPFQKQVTRDYLFHVLLSKTFTDYAVLGSARAGMPKVNRDHLFAFKVWLPDLKTQKELAGTLDDLQEATQRLTSLYEQKLAALVALKQSLLHHAFNGEL